MFITHGAGGLIYLFFLHNGMHLHTDGIVFAKTSEDHSSLATEVPRGNKHAYLRKLRKPNGTENGAILFLDLEHTLSSTAARGFK